MDTKARLAGFLRKWRRTRGEVKQAKDAHREELQAEELQMAKEGLSRRPGGYML